MPAERLASAEAFGARRAHIVLVHGFNERRSQDPRKDRRLWRRECNRGQQERSKCRPEPRIPSVEPSRWKPPETDRDKQYEKHREPEIRKSDSGLRNAHDCRTRSAPPLCCRKNPKREGNEKGQDGREKCEWQGNGDCIGDQSADINPVGVTRPEVPSKKAQDPLEVSLKCGRIESHFTMQRTNCIWAGIEAHHVARRIAGHYLKNYKDDRGCRNHGRSKGGQSA